MAFRKILVPLDGSEVAEAAIPYARAAGRSRDSRVVLITVIGASEERYNHPIEAYLAEKVEALESKGAKVSTAIARGDAADEVIEFADGNKVDLIVISSHGYSGIKRRIIGSVAQKVLHGTCVPTLLVKPGAGVPSEVEFKKLIVALDGSPFAETSILYAEQLVRGAGAEIILLRVSDPPVVPPAWSRDADSHRKEYQRRLTAELEQQAMEYLEKAKGAFTRKRIKVRPQAVVGMAAEAIMELAHKENVDVVALTTHGRSGVSRWVHGSVASKIAQECQRPVLLVRPCPPERPRPK
jgi:nucleotide-binding universal stress UspA family protein